MFSQEEITIANKTSRANGAVGKNAITPRAVREYLELSCDKSNTMVLDFGAGKTAAHARALQDEGWMATAFEFGANVDPRFHNELALMQLYDVVYASNVLNVQSTEGMLRTTIGQLHGVLLAGGVLFANYPSSPRKSDVTTVGMFDMLLEKFNSVKVVGGTNQAPVLMCTK